MIKWNDLTRVCVAFKIYRRKMIRFMKRKTIRFMKLLSSLYRYSYEKGRSFSELISITEISRIISLHIKSVTAIKSKLMLKTIFRQVPLINNEVSIVGSTIKYDQIRGTIFLEVRTTRYEVRLRTRYSYF